MGSYWCLGIRKVCIIGGMLNTGTVCGPNTYHIYNPYTSKVWAIGALMMGL